jgi:hypothetical protein
MLLPVELVDNLYKVHAHREGFAEVMSRVSRENQGFMPILALQKAISHMLVDKNRQKVFQNFDAGKAPPKPRHQPTQVNSATTNSSEKLDCCYKFLEGKCQDVNCIHPHVKVPVPPGVCALYLADRDSCSGCGKQHMRWGGIIKKMNEGQLPKSAPQASKGKDNKKKPTKKKQVTTTTAPSTPNAKKGGGDKQAARGNSGDRGKKGGRGGKGGKGNQKEKPDVTCTRCAQKGHELAGCWASTHADGHKLTCPKPAPIPAKFQKTVTSIRAGEDDNDWDYDLMAERNDNEMCEYEEAIWPTMQINVLQATNVNDDPDAFLCQEEVDGRDEDARFQRALNIVVNVFSRSAPDFQAAIIGLHQRNLDLFLDIVQEQEQTTIAEQETITELVDNTKHALSQVGILNSALDMSPSTHVQQASDSQHSAVSRPPIPDLILQETDAFSNHVVQPAHGMAVIDVDSSSIGAGFHWSGGLGNPTMVPMESLHWNVADAFIRTAIHEDQEYDFLPPLEDVSSDGEVKQDFKECENAAPEGLFIAPLEAPPTFIIQQADQFDSDLFETLGLSSYSLSAPTAARQGRQ